jgi:hypothetical protein
MAGGVQSNWKLTLDPAGTPQVLVNIADRLAAEVEAGNRSLGLLPPHAAPRKLFRLRLTMTGNPVAVIWLRR